MVATAMQAVLLLNAHGLHEISVQLCGLSPFHVFLHDGTFINYEIIVRFLANLVNRNMVPVTPTSSPKTSYNNREIMVEKEFSL